MYLIKIIFQKQGKKYMDLYDEVIQEKYLKKLEKAGPLLKEVATIIMALL